MVKDLGKTVAQYGPNGQYMQALLDNITELYLTPQDWRILCGNHTYGRRFSALELRMVRDQQKEGYTEYSDRPPKMEFGHASGRKAVSRKW